MISKPTDLPAVRAELLAFFGEHGVRFFRTNIDSGVQPLRPRVDPATDAELLAAAELYRLRKGELFWVSADMTDLAEAAARTLPKYRLQREDLPAAYGLVVFERPVGESRTSEYGGHDETGFVRAVTWGPTPPGLPDGVWLSWYTDTYLTMENGSAAWMAHMFGLPLAQAEAELPELRRRARRGVSSLMYDNEALMLFGEAPVGAVSLTGELIDTSENPYPLEVLLTTWTLMQQPIASVDSAHIDRPTRRRLQRAGVEPAPVRVINLRRPKGSASDAETDREYRHRWIVRGHWRQQWYPTRQDHRPVWIAPHIKGPDEAPLIGGEKVHAWRR